MKVYKVKVNGKVYEVELESVDEKAGSIAEAPKAEAPKAPVATGEAKAFLSPLQGNVIKINVTPGSQVKKGDVMLVIEAMKLENDIVAPYDGVVKSVEVSKGQQVNSKEVLLYFG